MSRYVLTPDARGDLRGIRNYIAQHNPRRAVTYVREITEVFRQLAKFPLMGEGHRFGRYGVRSHPHGSHVILFRPASFGVEIVGVAHHAQDIYAALQRRLGQRRSIP